MGFLGRIALIYGLLILPWPGLSELYGRHFRAVCRIAFAREEGARLIHFSANPEGSRHPLDTQVVLANRAPVDAKGAGRWVVLAFDLRAVGWLPLALLTALVLATRGTWGRRMYAWLAGLLWVHAYVILFVAVYVWTNSDASNGLDLLTLSPLRKRVLWDFHRAMSQSWAPFCGPGLIGAMLVFHQLDFLRPEPASAKNHRAENQEPRDERVARRLGDR